MPVGRQQYETDIRLGKLLAEVVQLDDPIVRDKADMNKLNRHVAGWPGNPFQTERR